MQTIKILKILINVLFIGLIAIFALGILFLIGLLFFNDHLPPIFQAYKMIFNMPFKWYVFLGPFSYIFAYVLFVVSIYYLRKCIKPFEESDFYSETVIENLRKAGSLFIFISVSAVVIRLIAAVYMNSLVSNVMSNSMYSGLKWVNILASSVDISSAFLLIIGLFFLFFSKVFENAKGLKEESDLTI